jgi:hypothetical protein
MKRDNDCSRYRAFVWSSFVVQFGSLTDSESREYGAGFHRHGKSLAPAVASR